MLTKNKYQYPNLNSSELGILGWHVENQIISLSIFQIAVSTIICILTSTPQRRVSWEHGKTNNLAVNYPNCSLNNYLYPNPNLSEGGIIGYKFSLHVCTKINYNKNSCATNAFATMAKGRMSDINRIINENGLSR